MSDKIKNKLGFGVMRLPLTDGEVNKADFCKMADLFMDEGFNYFDTAYGYMECKSENAVRDCVSARYPRESFVLADKISDWFFENEADILPMFNKQLENCGVDYFDFYLVHCVRAQTYRKHKECRTFEILTEFKNQGKIKHLAMSFHDSADVLDMILAEQPMLDAVQLQFNYLDYDDPTVQSKLCYDVAVKHGKKVIVMEPLKGGALVNLPAEAEKIIRDMGMTPASYGLRFVASFPEVFMILSGMNTVEMVQENTTTFKSLKPLTDDQMEKSQTLRDIIRKSRLIPCTACNYCKDVCSAQILVSEIFGIYNMLLGAKISRGQALELLTPYKESIEKCISCKKCESVCPQKINIAGNIEKIRKILQ